MGILASAAKLYKDYVDDTNNTINKENKRAGIKYIKSILGRKNAIFTDLNYYQDSTSAYYHITDVEEKTSITLKLGFARRKGYFFQNTYCDLCYIYEWNGIRVDYSKIHTPIVIIRNINKLGEAYSSLKPYFDTKEK